MAVLTEIAGTPIYVDQPLMDAQMQSLRALGFDFHKFLEQKMYPFLGRYTYRLRRRRFRSQFVDGDAVFIRSLLALEKLEVQRLVHLAILAEAVFDSQDVVLKILTLLEDSGHPNAEAIHRYIDQLPYADPR
ncbi:hypothetical protein [Pseudopelagicola sp. nBUS_19]|uniref:hypothetical protein n=1 Tax=Pseudopelagicola sp. nBUS_19 TaxID=3395316 RepID=UPI003EBCBB53